MRTMITGLVFLVVYLTCVGFGLKHSMISQADAQTIIKGGTR